MAPYIDVHDAATDSNVDISRLKSEVGVAKLAATEKPPVADDFMYDFKYNHALPTFDVLGIEIPADCDAQKEAEAILASLSDALGKGDAQAFTDLFLEYGKVSNESPLSQLVED